MALKSDSRPEKHQIETILKGFEERYALLSGEGMEYRWPIKYLPDNVKIGDTVYLQLKTLSEQKNEQYHYMRDLLTELVN